MEIEPVPGNKLVPRRIEELRRDIGQASLRIRLSATEVRQHRPEWAKRVHQAEWHMRGLVYHFARMSDAYMEFAQGIGGRAQIDVGEGARPDVLVMHAPSYQSMLFDFYALVNLARISLDSLRSFLAPVFVTRFAQLPKSFTDMAAGETDCPVYLHLRRDETFYLCDLRNCLVHFRSLATSDNVVVTRAGVDLAVLKDAVESDWLSSMARATFRETERGIVVNVLVPDEIFVRSPGGGKQLAQFSYTRKWNVLAAARDFVMLIHNALAETFQLLRDPGMPTFRWKKRSSDRTAKL